MASGDLQYFHNAAVVHAQNVKKLVSQAKELRAFWDKLDLFNSLDTAQAPLVNNDLSNYASFCSVLQDLMDNVAVAAADRRGVVERVATTPVSK